MKRSLYKIAGYKAFQAHCKTEALRHLIEGVHEAPLTDREDSVRAGLSYILEDISNQMRAVYQMLDVSNGADLDLEFTDPDQHIKGYPLHGFENVMEMIKASKQVNQ